jgi:hypothetical protein
MPRPAVIHCTSPDPTGPAIPEAVAVLHVAGEDVRDRLDAAMWVPGKAGQVVVRNVIAEIVEQEKRIELGGAAEPERPAKMHARALARRLRFDEPLDRSDGHDVTPRSPPDVPYG